MYQSNDIREPLKKTEKIKPVDGWQRKLWSTKSSAREPALDLVDHFQCAKCASQFSLGYHLETNHGGMLLL